MRRPRERPCGLCQADGCGHKLELVVVPVSAVDRAKAFHERAGLRLDVARTDLLERGVEVRRARMTNPAA